MTIKSPCVGICSQHPEYKICVNSKGDGCHRSRLEIRMWPIAKSHIQEEILENCARKKELYKQFFVENDG